MKMLPIPKSLSELPELTFKEKGDWEGKGWLMAILVWLMEYSMAILLGAGWLSSLIWDMHPLFMGGWIGASIGVGYGLNILADTFMHRFHTVWYDNVCWMAVGRLIVSAIKFIEPHEQVHAWHASFIKGWKLKYINPVPAMRRHAEAAAYALDVIQGRRTVAQAAKSMTSFIYFMFMSEHKARMLIMSYMIRWREECDDFKLEDNNG